MQAILSRYRDRARRSDVTVYSFLASVLAIISLSAVGWLTLVWAGYLIISFTRGAL